MNIPIKFVADAPAALAAGAESLSRADRPAIAAVDELQQLGGRLAGLELELTTARSAAIASGGAHRGAQLLDTTSIPGGPFPTGAPVLDLREGVERLREKAFQWSPVASLSGQLDGVLARPLHRDAARVIGQPLVQFGDASGAEQATLAYAVRQVGDVEGYQHVDAAAYAAMHLAATGGSSGAIAVVHASDHAGAARLVLVELDDGLRSAADLLPLQYRTETGERSLVAGIADARGVWRDLQAAAPVDAPVANRATLMPIRDLDAISIVHYDPETAVRLTELEDAKAQVADLIRAIQDATGDSAPRVGEVARAGAAEVRSPAELFDSLVGSPGKVPMIPEREAVSWSAADVKAFRAELAKTQFVQQAKFSLAWRPVATMFREIAPVAQSLGYDAASTTAVVRAFASHEDPVWPALYVLKTGRTIEDYVAAQQVDGAIKVMVGHSYSGLRSVVGSRLDVAEIRATMHRLARESIPDDSMAKLIDWSIANRATGADIDNMFSGSVQQAFIDGAPSGNAHVPADHFGHMLAAALPLKATFAEISDVLSRTMGPWDFESELTNVVKKRALVDSLA